MLALDWRSAFDAVNIDALLAALSRFGVPDHMVSMIGNIYADRRFRVETCDGQSEEKTQASGSLRDAPYLISYS